MGDACETGRMGKSVSEMRTESSPDQETGCSSADVCRDIAMGEYLVQGSPSLGLVVLPSIALPANMDRGCRFNSIRRSRDLYRVIRDRFCHVDEGGMLY